MFFTFRGIKWTLGQGYATSEEGDTIKFGTDEVPSSCFTSFKYEVDPYQRYGIMTLVSDGEEHYYLSRDDMLYTKFNEYPIRVGKTLKIDKNMRGPGGTNSLIMEMWDCEKSMCSKCTRVIRHFTSG